MTTESVAQFGRALIQYGGVMDTAPAITLSVDKYHDFFEYIMTNQEEAFLLGFFKLFMQTLPFKWESFTPAQIELLKSDLIRCCSVKFPSLYLSHRFTTIVAWVFKLTNGNWPELISYIFFESNKTDNVGFLLSKAIKYMENTDFQENNKRIYDRLFNLIPAVSIPVKLRLLNVFCDIQGFALTAAFWSLFWSATIECIKDDKSNEAVIFNILSHFALNLNEREKIEPPLIEDDNDYLYFISLIGLLNTIDFYRALNRIVGIMAKMYEKGFNTTKNNENGFPMAIFDSMILVNRRKISTEKRMKAIEILKNSSTSKENREFSLFVTLPFLPMSIMNGIKLEDIGLTFLDEFSIGSKDQQQLWLRAISILARSLVNAHLLPTNAQTTVLSMIQSENEEMSSLAFEALDSLFESLVFTAPEQLRSFFISYDRLNNGQKAKFIRSVQLLIEAGRFDINLLQLIEEFIRNSLKWTTDIYIHASCLALIASLSNINIAIAATYVKEVLPIITSVINSKKYELFPDAARLLLIFCMVQPALSRRTLTNAYPKLVQFVKTVNDPKYDFEQGKVGESIAGLIETTLKKKELPEAFSITDIFLKSDSKNLNIAATNMIQVYTKMMNRSTASPVYSELARAAFRTKDEQLMNRCIECMRKLFKQFQVTPNLTIRFAYSMLTEFHQVFMKQAIYSWNFPNASLFPFVTFVIEKVPKEVGILLPIIQDVCTKSSDEMFTETFDMIAAAFGVGLVTELPSQRLYDICYKDVFKHHSTVALSFVIEKISDQLKEFTLKLQEEWKSININNSDQLFWRCAVSDALVQLIDRKQEIDMKILEKILEEFPYRPEFGFCEEMCKHFIETFKENEDYCRPVELQYVKAFAEFLLMEKSDFLAYRVNYDTQMQMKAEIRRIMKGNKAYEKEMTKYYSKNKTKLNVFFSFMQ